MSFSICTIMEAIDRDVAMVRASDPDHRFDRDFVLGLIDGYGKITKLLKERAYHRMIAYTQSEELLARAQSELAGRGILHERDYKDENERLRKRLADASEENDTLNVSARQLVDYNDELHDDLVRYKKLYEDEKERFAALKRAYAKVNEEVKELRALFD